MIGPDAPTEPDEWRVNVYVDESKPSKDCRWLFIGALLIPSSRLDEAQSHLDHARAITGYDGELHFQNLKRSQKRRLAEAWLQLILTGVGRIFHFYLLGIDTETVDRRRFGDNAKTQEAQLYARTFRMAVSYALKNSAKRRRPIVEHLFHDRGDMESHEVFAWHSQWRMTQDHGIEFATQEVTFVDSDHTQEARYPQASHFIQMADLATGAFRQCLEAPSTQSAKAALGRQCAPLLIRITDPKLAKNPNSRYDHLGRVAVSFWPSATAAEGENPFYSSRAIKGLDPEQGVQAVLFSS